MLSLTIKVIFKQKRSSIDHAAFKMAANEFERLH